MLWNKKSAEDNIISVGKKGINGRYSTEKK